MPNKLCVESKIKNERLLVYPLSRDKVLVVQLLKEASVEVIPLLEVLWLEEEVEVIHHTVEEEVLALALSIKRIRISMCTSLDIFKRRHCYLLSYLPSPRSVVKRTLRRSQMSTLPRLGKGVRCM